MKTAGGKVRTTAYLLPEQRAYLERETKRRGLHFVSDLLRQLVEETIVAAEHPLPGLTSREADFVQSEARAAGTTPADYLAGLLRDAILRRQKASTLDHSHVALAERLADDLGISTRRYLQLLGDALHATDQEPGPPVATDDDPTPPAASIADVRKALAESNFDADDTERFMALLFPESEQPARKTG